MLNFNSDYKRLGVYTSTLIMGLLPAWLAGWVHVDAAGLLRIDMLGLATAAAVAVILSQAVFAKWGVKPETFTGSDLFGSYLRVVMYSITGLVGLLPASVAGTVYIDTVNYVLTVDMPSLAYAVTASLGLNVGIFKLFGLKSVPR